jgi:hypothetical protein
MIAKFFKVKIFKLNVDSKSYENMPCIEFVFGPIIVLIVIFTSIINGRLPIPLRNRKNP